MQTIQAPKIKPQTITDKEPVPMLEGELKTCVYGQGIRLSGVCMHDLGLKGARHRRQFEFPSNSPNPEA